MRTVRHKIYQLNELSKAAKEKAQKAFDILESGAREEYDKLYRGFPGYLKPFYTEWKKEHYDINKFEFTQEGNIFYK